MVNFAAPNCPNEREVYNQELKELLKETFKYTKEVNVHVLYNFLSPTNTLGEYDCVLFIDVPYQIGNYFRTQSKIYLNSVAIAVRIFDEPEIIDVDDNSFYTKDGSWDYSSEIESDRQALRSYVYNHMSDIKHFDLAIIYIVNAPNCNKKFRNKKLVFNMEINWWQAVNYAIELTQNRDGVASDCIIYKDKDIKNGWSHFISHFIEIADEHTHQGILTKKKIDYITKKKLTRLMEQANMAIGNKMCIIKGKAGTGKTMALLKLMYEQVRAGVDAPRHNCRLLTYNNMLVMDLRMIMKGIGPFTPTKASISSLHKFFYRIYIDSPVRFLHMDEVMINNLFTLCLVRTMRFNFLMQTLSTEKHTDDLVILANELVEEISKKESRIKEEDRAECKEYRKYLINRSLKGCNMLVSETFTYALEYVDYKRKVFLDNYHRKEFLNGYNIILEELYLVFHNLDEFVNKYKMKLVYSNGELGNASYFKEKYQKLYNEFINAAKNHLQEEYGSIDDLIPNFMHSMEKFYRDRAAEYANKSTEDTRDDILVQLKKIKRRVNWSKLILVDEAQDCQVNEKALLLELHGSDNTVIATGGHDQLIRTAQENDWSQLFGRYLDAEKITLRNVSYRQKENIILFLNAFAEAFDIETRLSVPDETKNSGRVIIDCRSFDNNLIPLDVINSLHLNGKDMGCSNFENMVFLLPNVGYVERNKTDETDVEIDTNSTIIINQASPLRKLSMSIPANLNPIDGTVNDKRRALKNVGQDNTRCLLYESCRGIEAWNVMCMDLNDFYNDKIISKDAEEYAESYTGGLFEEGRDKYMAQYASLWCFMAMTRAIDTLYIKLSNTRNAFSQTLLSVARKIQHVEILEGNYETPSNEQNDEELPF